jgi:hypothetical protein
MFYNSNQTKGLHCPKQTKLFLKLERSFKKLIYIRKAESIMFYMLRLPLRSI